MGGNIILCSGIQAINAGDFYAELLTRHGSMAVDQLLELLEDHFGLKVNHSRVLEKIKGTPYTSTGLMRCCTQAIQRSKDFTSLTDEMVFLPPFAHIVRARDHTGSVGLNRRKQREVTQNLAVFEG